ncbi:hypothetical protein BU16DRAFT_585062 [Lophium mytilinum]|uniref:Prokaryotic-type class I peptide chain release factors domain-containing protein n=1 Tax=Lophium mytilinum TaxID=390894 RepID=A0A6A6QI52_9PEZI|nr:hypothetical protein BU16DRAFT_585062 [Lophium mytilinum]
MTSSKLLRPLLRPQTLRLSKCLLRPFSTTLPLPSKPLPPRLLIPENDMIENFLKGSGPGGQKINKTSSAVQLKHIPTGIVIKCQDTRSRSQNRKVARRLLAERVEELELGEGARTAVKAREKSKKKASGDKKRRRKYRALAEGEKDDGDDLEGEVVGVEGKESVVEQSDGGKSAVSKAHEEIPEKD